MLELLVDEAIRDLPAKKARNVFEHFQTSTFRQSLWTAFQLGRREKFVGQAVFDDCVTCAVIDDNVRQAVFDSNVGWAGSEDTL